MTFIRLWLTGYVMPRRFVDELKTKPAPHWGVYAQLLRAALDSLLVFLPVALMGRVPPTPSYLGVIPSDRYYAALVGIAPVVLMAQLLLASSFLHVMVRQLGMRSDFDQILNIVGMSDLVVGAFLVPWDWMWFAVGVGDQISLGISHLVLSLWATYLTALGLKRTLDVPLVLAIPLSILVIPVCLPLGVMFMRSPF
ncbi:MAG: YIP1 family protein [Anaerolineae bacterium]|jgi:hypothetical protein